MLKKKLCKKCMKRLDIGWIEDDEIWWEEQGIVYCPMIYLGEKEIIYRDITDKPPSKCPYFLENIL